MDQRGHIYSAPENLITPEDKARLEGYLKGREDADLLSEAKTAAFEAKVREMEAARERGNDT